MVRYEPQERWASSLRTTAGIDSPNPLKLRLDTAQYETVERALELAKERYLVNDDATAWEEVCQWALGYIDDHPNLLTELIQDGFVGIDEGLAIESQSFRVAVIADMFVTYGPRYHA